jgi:hypothetical protein
MKNINWNNKLLDSIYFRRDIDSLSKVISLVENKSLLTKFIQLLRNYFQSRRKLLDCLFQVIDHIDIRAFDDLLLISSCDFGNLNLVKYLIENGVDAHKWNDLPLRLAIKRDCQEIIEYLIKNGAFVRKLKY